MTKRTRETARDATLAVVGDTATASARAVPAFLDEPTSAADDRETPMRALRDVAALLRALAAEKGEDSSPFRIYDPYYCRGGIRTRLLPLLPTTFTIYNAPEDFYRVKREGRCPDHGVVLTNPPYSRDHVRRAIEYYVSRKAPWIMLLPHNTILRNWFPGVIARDLSPPLFLCPHQRYAFLRKDVAKNGETVIGSESQKHVPFVTVWFIGGLSAFTRMTLLSTWESCDRKQGATLAQSLEEMPRRIKKILKFAENRACKKKTRTEERLRKKQKKKKK